ncbi:MAG: hypothetical protein ABDK94_06265 [Atribacterota bacterium]
MRAYPYWKTLFVYTDSWLSPHHALILLAKTLQRSLHIQEVRQIVHHPDLTIEEEIPLLFLAENHASTAFIYQHLVSRFTHQKRYLLVLDTHLDIFSQEENTETIHRGNFLRYLLKNGILEDHALLVPSLHSPVASLREGLSHLGEGLYYLSWDLDFGLPRCASFPSPLSLTFRELREIFRLIGSHFRKPRRHLIGMDIVEMNIDRPFHLSKLSFQITTLLQYLHLQKSPHFELPHLDRFNQKKYAKCGQ